jgi:hypothetical protein
MMTPQESYVERIEAQTPAWPESIAPETGAELPGVLFPAHGDRKTVLLRDGSAYANP